MWSFVAAIRLLVRSCVTSSGCMVTKAMVLAMPQNNKHSLMMCELGSSRPVYSFSSAIHSELCHAEVLCC